MFLVETKLPDDNLADVWAWFHRRGSLPLTVRYIFEAAEVLLRVEFESSLDAAGFATHFKGKVVTLAQPALPPIQPSA